MNTVVFTGDYLVKTKLVIKYHVLEQVLFLTVWTACLVISITEISLINLVNIDLSLGQPTEYLGIKHKGRYKLL